MTWFVESPAQVGYALIVSPYVSGGNPATFTSVEPLRDINTRTLLSNTSISYIVIKPDGSEVSGTAITDSNGYLSASSVTFGVAGDIVRVIGENPGTAYFTGFKVVLT